MVCGDELALLPIHVILVRGMSVVMPSLYVVMDWLMRIHLRTVTLVRGMSLVMTSLYVVMDLPGWNECTHCKIGERNVSGDD